MCFITVDKLDVSNKDYIFEINSDTEYYKQTH